MPARRRRSRPFPRVLLSGQPAVTLTSPYAVAGCALTGTPNPPCVTGAVDRRRRPRDGRRRAGRDHDGPVDLRADRHAADARRRADARAGDVRRDRCMPDLDFPYHFSGLGRTATTDRDDHIRDLIEQVLFTAPGERVMRPDFGAGLLALVFEPNSTHARRHHADAGAERAAALPVAPHRGAGRRGRATTTRRCASTSATPCCSTARTHSATFTAPGGDAMRFHCCDLRRLEVLRRSGSANAIEFLEVLDKAAPAGGAAPADAVRAPAAAGLHADAGQPAHHRRRAHPQRRHRVVRRRPTPCRRRPSPASSTRSTIWRARWSSAPTAPATTRPTR